jgi:cystathionine beta-lyase
MEFALAPPIASTVTRNVDASLLAYADTVTREQIKAATAYWLETRFNWLVNPADVFYVADILAGYEAVIRNLTQPNAPIIIPTPVYGPLLATPAFFDRAVVQVPCCQDAAGRYVLDYEALDAVLTPGALFVLTNPYNPVGQVFRRDELERLCALITKHDALVFSDEVHSPLILAENIKHIPYATIAPAAAQHCVTAVSASKAFNITGLKTAQLIIPGTELRRTWRKVAPFYADGASRLGLSANVAAYTDPASLVWLEQTIETLRANYLKLKLHFALNHPDIKVFENEATYLAWIDVRGLNLGEKASDFFLKQARVALSDGSEFRAPGFVRINFALEPSTLQQMLTQITRAIRARQLMQRSLRTLNAIDEAILLERVGL